MVLSGTLWPSHHGYEVVAADGSIVRVEMHAVSQGTEGSSTAVPRVLVGDGGVREGKGKKRGVESDEVTGEEAKRTK